MNENRQGVLGVAGTRRKTVVITGGTSGIGRHTAIGLAAAGMTVVVTGRSRERGEEGVRVLRQASGSDDVHLALGDLSSRASLEALASELSRRWPRIDVLVHNAGLLATERAVNEEGLELHFAVNVLAPYRLTRALEDALPRGGRVVLVTGGLPLWGLDASDLFAEREFEGLRTYSRSKRAMEAMSLELARELEPRGVGVFVVFPGSAVTAMSAGITPGALPWFMRPAWPIFTRVMQRDDGGESAARASRSSVWAASAPELEGKTALAFDQRHRPMKLHRSVRAPEGRARVLAAVTGLST
ncbi:MAG: SDR family NAD(P)-dependent oxidoreductase [Polyangiaceae bacterium]